MPREASTQTESAGEAGGGKLNRGIMRYVGTRIFYKVDGVWTDRNYKAGLKETKLVYGSDEYFEFLLKHPELKEVFALGTKLGIQLGKWLGPELGVPLGRLLGASAWIILADGPGVGMAVGVAEGLYIVILGFVMVIMTPVPGITIEAPQRGGTSGHSPTWRAARKAVSSS